MRPITVTSTPIPLLRLYGERDSIDLDPEYQRQGDLWTKEKRQLLIDSIINGLDIPKIYLHEFQPAKDVSGRLYRYAIVDGKQRLQSIWGFIDGDFPLSADFEYFEDKAVKAAGMDYATLATEFPRLRAEFDGSALPIVSIRTDDEELIQELFSRLNEAVSLNAAEKRNAFPGPMPRVVRGVALHPFFTRNLPFPNRRYRHFDLATKFLFFEQRGGVGDTKKAYLDRFVRDYQGRSDAEADEIRVPAEQVLSGMSSVFLAPDALLASVGMVSLYYLLFRDALLDEELPAVTRERLEEFEDWRRKNRALAQEDDAGANYDLLEFDRFTQSPNDGIALRFRLSVIRSFLQGTLEIDERLRNFVMTGPPRRISTRITS